MTTKPLYNALLAIGYIALIITGVFLSSTLFPFAEESIFIPMGMLSLLVLSAAIMAFLFFYQPVLMLIEGKREEAVKFFLKTIGIFALGTGILLLTALLVSNM